jgi:hypothetical protein
MKSDHWFILRNRLASHLRIAGGSALFIAAAAMAFIAVRPALPIRPTAKTPALFHPAVAEWQLLASSTTPPAEADCMPQAFGVSILRRWRTLITSLHYTLRDSGAEG